MARDPITLVVSLDASGAATGELYLDDGSSFEYQQGAYAHRTFSFNRHMFSSRAAALTPVVAGGAPPRKGGAFSMPNGVERIVVQGLTSYALRRGFLCVQGGHVAFSHILTFGLCAFVCV
jgi:alpha 1,3-glucosidase